ncbi:MAG: PorP/SprF family type IX secretion system membrane protein [Burkholderiales bacterium]|nr:PorP/SprF family type IX secretion system membrane protein [Bacteroidia bacterium]
MKTVLKMKKIILAFIIIPLFGKAQDIHFSQFNETPVLLNPAMSCTAFDTRIIANYKNQWASVTSPFQTYGISIERALKHLKLKKAYTGMSLSIYNDKAGDAGLGSLLVNLGFNVILKTGKFTKLSAGLGGGINYRTINPSKLQWESQYNGSTYDAAIASGEKIPKSSFVQADFVGGLAYHYAKSEHFISAQDGTKFDIGFSAFHYNMPTYSFVNSGDKQFTKFILHSNFDIGIKNAGMAIVPSFLYSRQGPSQETNVGCMFKYIIQDQSVYTGIKKPCAIAIGAFYRVGDAFIPSLLFQYDKYAFTVSYDLNTSQLAGVSKAKGGLEFSLRFNTSPGYGKALGNSVNRPTYK